MYGCDPRDNCRVGMVRPTHWINSTRNGRLLDPTALASMGAVCDGSSIKWDSRNVHVPVAMAVAATPFFPVAVPRLANRRRALLSVALRISTY